MDRTKIAIGLASSLSITGADAQSGSNVEMAEWSKAMRLGRIPKGRGFKSHSRHFVAGHSTIDRAQVKLTFTGAVFVRFHMLLHCNASRFG